VRNPELSHALRELRDANRVYLEPCDADEVFNSQQVTAYFKHVQVRDRLVWHPAIRRALRDIGYPAGTSRRWWHPHTYEFARLWMRMRLSRLLYGRFGRVPVRALLRIGAPLAAVASVMRKASRALKRSGRQARRVYRRLRASRWVPRLPSSFVAPKRSGFRVLIAGGYGYGNTGDEAQLAASIFHWQRMVPGAEVIVLSPDPEYTSSLHGVRSEAASRVVFFDALRNPDYRCSNDAFKRRFFQSRRRLMWNARLLRSGFPLTGVSQAEARFLGLLASADVLHLSGGGYLTGMTLSRLWDHMLLIRLCDVLGTPAILSGQTIGVFKDAESRELARWGLTKARFIYLRDRGGSFRDLESIGVAGPHVQETFDDALFAPQIDEAEVASILARAGVKPGRRYAAVHLHNWGLDGEGTEQVVARYAQLCDRLAAEHDLAVLLVP
jgi:polysaccharide pyruvyl transferase WcaK-like protein